MGDLEKAKELLSQVETLIDSHIQDMGTMNKHSEGGVSTTSSMSSQMGSPSAEVMLTGGLKSRKRKLKKADAAGIITTIDGKKLKLTGLTEKEKDEYIFGDTKIEKALNYVDYITEVIEAITAPELEEDFGDNLEKCDLSKTSKMIKNKEGSWRRIAGRPCFICGDGMIHAGPQAFIGKKAATLRDDLRSERKKSKKAKKAVKSSK